MLLGGPRWHQDGASRHQDAQDDAKRAPDGSTTGEVVAKIDPSSSKQNIEKSTRKIRFFGASRFPLGAFWGCLGGVLKRLKAVLRTKMAPKRCKMAPRWAKAAPRRPKMDSKPTRMGLKRCKMAPRRAK